MVRRDNRGAQRMGRAGPKYKIYYCGEWTTVDRNKAATEKGSKGLLLCNGVIKDFHRK